jgi:O-antigen chain-terminating methyltransferase
MNNKIDNFYKAFEDRFRGSNQVIKSRLSIYLPYVKTLHSIYPNIQCLDLGCGRGEWLELLSDNSINGYGVDINAKMVEASSDQIKVIVGDVLDHLKLLPNDSIDLITGFHIAEHLTFENLFTLIEESFRVLKPTGLLILETPNSENITVGTSGFYMDPTHIRPIPLLQLSFLTEYVGFYRNQTLGLQEWEKFQDETTPVSLYQVFNGVSPDYSVISQKNGDAKNIQLFDTLFSRKYGILLEDIANRYFLQQHNLYNSLRIKLLQISESNETHDNFINTFSDSIKLMNFLTYPITKLLKKLNKMFQ